MGDPDWGGSPAARTAGNLDQAELARRADLSVGAVKNLETGRGPSLRTLVRVVRALGRTEWLASLAPPITVRQAGAVGQSEIRPFWLNDRHDRDGYCCQRGKDGGVAAGESRDPRRSRHLREGLA